MVRVGLALLGALVAPGQAAAATVSSTTSCSRVEKTSELHCRHAVSFRAAAGEVNSVTAELDPEPAGEPSWVEGTVSLSDAGAVLEPGESCVAVTPQRVRCVPSLTSDEAQEVVRTTALGTISAGDQDDAITARGWTVIGGPGDDRIVGAGTVSYAERDAPITVDMQAGTGGQAGEHDTFIEIESITGGSGDDLMHGGYLRGGPGNDRLTGTQGLNYLDGGAGHDTLQGAGADDHLGGGPGRDRLFGGKGADTLTGGPGADRLSGGIGADFLDAGPGADVLSGGRGSDDLLGGAGDDVLRARDHERDHLWGEGGSDTLIRDRVDRVFAGNFWEGGPCC